MRKNQITVKEYALLRGVQPNSVTKNIRLGHYLPCVKRVEKKGNLYLLDMANDFESKLKALFQK